MKTASVIVFVVAFSAEPSVALSDSALDFVEPRVEFHDYLVPDDVCSEEGVTTPFWEPHWHEEFAALGADWDNYDALPPNGRALSEAKYFDSVVGDEIDFIPRPMSNGSVAFYYRTPSFLAEIEIDGSGTAVLAVVGTDSTLATAEEFPLKRPEIRDIPRRIKGYERMLAGSIA